MGSSRWCWNTKPTRLRRCWADVTAAPYLGPVDHHRALVGRLQATDQVQQRALARARAAGDPDELAGLHAQIHAAHGADRAIALADHPPARPRPRSSVAAHHSSNDIIAGRYARSVLALTSVNLLRRAGRPALTALGVAVGVTTVVALLALTDGLERSAGDLAHLGRADFGVFQAGLADLTASSLPASRSSGRKRCRAWPTPAGCRSWLARSRANRRRSPSAPNRAASWPGGCHDLRASVARPGSHGRKRRRQRPCTSAPARPSRSRGTPLRGLGGLPTRAIPSRTRAS